MKIALLQYPIQWADPQTNLGLLDERLRAVAGQVELAVIPEMFSTGFCTDRPGLADEWLTGHTSQALQHMADEYNLAIVGSMMAMDHGKLYNRGFIFRPNDSPQYYDKHHLYASGGEAEFFTPGNERKLFEFRGVKIRLAVCYDLRFPVWLRQDKNNLYDILICVACWPTIRIQYWDALLAARAAKTTVTASASTWSAQTDSNSITTVTPLPMTLGSRTSQDSTTTNPARVSWTCPSRNCGISAKSFRNGKKRMNTN